MNYHTTNHFWKHYDRLPDHVKKLADKNFALLKHDHRHASLEFKKIENMWSVRVGAHYRALGFDHKGFVL